MTGVIDSTISGNTGETVVYKVIIDGKPYALKHYKPNMSLSDTAKKVITRIKDNPKDRIGEGAFQSNGLTSVTIPDNVTAIGKDAFQGNKLTSVTIPDNVTAIGEGAFQGNQLGSVVLPNSVTSIEINAFANNPLTSVRIGANVKLGDIGDFGVLGKGTGFNGAYANNGRRAGTYTRPDAKSTTWTRR